MQTFLPCASFLESARVLDPKRLGKQRVETLQILRALELPDYGWQNHPAVRMWRGRTEALVRYGLDVAETWVARGHPDSTWEQIREFAPAVSDFTQAELARADAMPRWLGDPRLHASHRSQLIAKDPTFYRPLFPDTPDGLAYYWPTPDPPGPEPAVCRARHTLWVLRPESEQLLGRAVLSGVVGFGEATGVFADAAGLDLAALRGLLDRPVRRPSRALRALADFVGSVQPNDDLGMLVSEDRALLVGRVTGDYEFRPRDRAGLWHARSVRWNRLVPRSAALVPSALQDVRPLFAVPWQPE